MILVPPTRPLELTVLALVPMSVEIVTTKTFVLMTPVSVEIVSIIHTLVMTTIHVLWTRVILFEDATSPQ